MGIARPGWIAERLAQALKTHTQQKLAAVGSRSRDRAAAFADRWSIPRAYGDVADMTADPAAGIVYVATPHIHHLPVAPSAIEAGKHVSVEKPLALDVTEAQQLRDAARRKGVLFVEAVSRDRPSGSRVAKPSPQSSSIGSRLACDNAGGQEIGRAGTRRGGAEHEASAEVILRLRRRSKAHPLLFWPR